MRFLFFLPLLFFGFSLSAQPEPKPTSFHFEFDLFGTRPTMVKEENDLKNRFERGGGMSFALRRNVSPLLSFEAGLGVQIFGIRQRRNDLRFGCDLPPIAPGAPERLSYLEATIGLSSATFHVAPIFHLERDRDGIYLKPKLRFNYNIGDEVSGDLHECGRDEGTSINVGNASGRKLTVFPGLGLGYQAEGERGKFSYIEINLAMSAGKTFTKAEDEDETSPLFGFWKESGALLGGITIGWQIGGGTKRNRRPKKERPAPVPGYYFGK